MGDAGTRLGAGERSPRPCTRTATGPPAGARGSWRQRPPRGPATPRWERAPGRRPAGRRPRAGTRASGRRHGPATAPACRRGPSRPCPSGAWRASTRRAACGESSRRRERAGPRWRPRIVPAGGRRRSRGAPGRTCPHGRTSGPRARRPRPSRAATGQPLPMHAVSRRAMTPSLHTMRTSATLSPRGTSRGPDHSGDWRSWLARMLDMHEVTGSSPVSPTTQRRPGHARPRTRQRLATTG